MYSPLALPERIRSKIAVEPSGCWRWTGALNAKGYGEGYGQVTHGGKPVYAHRLTYQLLVDPTLVLRPGHGGEPQLDHVAERCELHRACVNPSHLEPVTLRTNLQRGRVNRHGFTGVYVAASGRYCSKIRPRLGEHQHLGMFDSAAEAAAAYDAACVAIGATPANHAAGRLPEPRPDLVAEIHDRLLAKAAA